MQISDAELEIMKIVWANGEEPTLFAQLLEELTARGKTWQKNTLITLLGRLVNKGFLKAKKIGRRNEYTALVSESEYQTAQTRRFLDRVYEGNVRGLVSTLIQRDMLSQEDYDALRRFWEDGKR